MLLQRAAPASSSVPPFCAVKHARRVNPVIRLPATSARRCSPPCNTPPAWAAGTGLSAPAPVPVRFLIVRAPAISCTKHSGDSQEESMEQPTENKAPAASQEQPADSETPSAFFGRRYELQQLERLANSEPDLLRVVLGPRSCGITATLTKFHCTRHTVAVINMRRTSASTPAAFVKMVLEELEKAAPRTAFDAAVQRLMTATPAKQAGKTLAAFSQVVESLVEGVQFTAKDILSGVQGSPTGSTSDVTFNIGQVMPDALLRPSVKPNKTAAQPQRQPEPPEGDDIGSVFKAAEALVDAWATKKKQGELQEWPVIIVDEANVLMEWTDKYPSQLAELLRFLLLISKETGRCHVILATSEWGFYGWLETAIGYEFYKAEVIGDFQEKEARKFFELQLQRSEMELEETTWNKVFEVGGGNAGFLSALARDMARRREVVDKHNWDAVKELQWDQALSELVGPRWRATERHAEGGDALGWSEKQYAAAAEKLLRSHYHAVPSKEMAMLLGQHAQGGGSNSAVDLRVGRQVLQKMVAANALAVRPRSSWTRDVPVEAFEDAKEVVTAPSAVTVHCMRRLVQPVKEDLLEATSE